MAESLKQKTVSGVIWSAVDRFSSQGIQFVFSILIARLLLPEDFGVIAMLGIFLAVSQTFIDSGFGAALIRKIDRTEEDFSTVFYFNIAVAVFLYVLLWFASPLIADFYEEPLLETVTKVVGLTLIFNALSGIQSAQLSIAIDFKTRAKISVLTILITGSVTLWMAYNGYGVWALVTQAVLQSLLRSALLWGFVRWMPKRVFSKRSFKELFSFGSKLLASGLLDTLYNNIYTLVIGKAFSSAQLGLFAKADSFAQMPSSNITGVMQNVTFPVLSTIQNEEQRLADAYKRFLRVSAFIIFPLMVGLASIADPLIRWILTEKWVGAIVLLQIICFNYMLYPIHAINLNLLTVMGRSDYFLKLEVWKKILGVTILCVTLPFGLVVMCLGRVVGGWISLGLNTYYTKKLIGYGFFAQMKDFSHILLLSLTMGALVWGVTQLLPALWMKVVVGVVTGGCVYAGGAYLLRFSEMKELLALLKRKVM